MRGCSIARQEISDASGGRLQFERVIDEYAKWRAIAESERPPAPAWWWGPALDVRGLCRQLAAGLVRRLGLPMARAMPEARECC
jgi:hypothetical protein